MKLKKLFLTLFFILFFSGSVQAVDLRFGISNFPEDYQPYLKEIQAKYPNWNFTALYTHLDWDYVINQENVFGVNLVPKSYSDRWKNTTPGQHNVEVDAGWVDSSRQAVEYCMDPRNFLNPVRLFQFEELSYDEHTNNIDGIEKVLYGTEFYNRIVEYYNSSGQNVTTTDTYSSLISNASVTSSVSAYHIASRIKQEVGPFLSHSSISGRLAGYEGIYNFYNIGATSSAEPNGAIINGLKYASGVNLSQSTRDKYLIPWNTKSTAITGGAIFLGSSYIHLGQNNIYLQKFHVSDNDGNNLFWHQYMTNVLAPYSESNIIYNGYNSSGLLNNTLSFIIPVFDNMPETPVDSPSINPSDFVNDNTTMYANVSNTLNIRTGPGSSYEVLTTVTRDDDLTRIKKGVQSGELWDKVVLPNGIIGYAFQSYLVEKQTIEITNINLSVENTTMNKGESQTLGIELLPDEASKDSLQITSSDTTIAQVNSSGNIIAIRPGNVTITVKDSVTNITETIDLTIISKLTGIAVSPNEIHLDVNTSTTPTITFIPEDATNKNVTFTSKDKLIATVDSNGTITGVAIGKTEIDVITEDGNITKTITVQVTKPLTDEELSFDESLTITDYKVSGFDHTNMSVANIKSQITTSYNIEIYNNENQLLTDEQIAGTNSKIVIKNAEDNVLAIYWIVLYGDLNGDGKIDSVDLLVLQRHILELDMLDNIFIISGNIFKDGKTPSSLDSLLIQRHILELKLIDQ